MSKAPLPDVPQRWERPFNFPPGHWKKQLPTHVLNSAIQGDLDALIGILALNPYYLNLRGPHGRTLLWEAVRSGQYALAEWLIEEGADVNATGAYNQESYVQITPYCASVYYDRPYMAEYLLSQGSELDVFRAAFLGRMGDVAAQLEANPEHLNAEDPHDAIYFVPLLAFALAGGHLSLTEWLLKRGAVVEPYSAQLLHVATMNSRMDLLELLVSAGVNVEAADTGIYVLTSDLEILSYLLQHGASASRKGKNKFPPLVYLSRRDKGEHVDKLEVLLEYGAEINASGPKGRTALHYAARAGFLNVIHFLLNHGADVSLHDDEGYTPLDAARLNNKPAAADLLRHPK